LINYSIIKIENMKKIEVVAGIIIHYDEILCVQRPSSKLPYISEKFEFPGGKIEPNESQIDALHRELKEELDISVDIKSFFLTVEHQYPDFELIMHSYICEVDSKTIHLKEHIDQKWLKTDELEQLDWAAADIPIVNKLLINE
jgi:8-oxo-dGTP diphosphatase